MYSSDQGLAERFGVSRQTIWRLVKSDQTFPRPVRLTPGCTRWLLSEVKVWEDAKRTAEK